MTRPLSYNPHCTLQIRDPLVATDLRVIEVSIPQHVVKVGHCIPRTIPHTDKHYGQGIVAEPSPPPCPPPSVNFLSLLLLSAISCAGSHAYSTHSHTESCIQSHMPQKLEESELLISAARHFFDVPSPSPHQAPSVTYTHTHTHTLYMMLLILTYSHFPHLLRPLDNYSDLITSTPSCPLSYPKH